MITLTSKLLQECLAMQGADADRVAAALPDSGRFRLGAALRFLRRASSPFDVFFFLESLVAAGRGRKCDRMKTLFRDHASIEDKIELTVGWTFTEPYEFGSHAPLPPRHVAYPICGAHDEWIFEKIGHHHDNSSGCSTTVGQASLCLCEQWLRERPATIDPALDAVIGHLCDMRHSLVHESWPVFMVADPLPAGSLGITILDIYPCRGGFRTYESGITFERFRAIATATARGYLTSLTKA